MSRKGKYVKKIRFSPVSRINPIPSLDGPTIMPGFLPGQVRLPPAHYGQDWVIADRFSFVILTF